MSALGYWVWLSSLKGIGARSADKIIEVFGSPEKAFFADDRMIEDTTLSKFEKDAIKDKSLGRAEEIMRTCRDKNIRILTINDAEYPERLKNIYDPPAVLYVRGSLPQIDDEAAVAIVGTRRCTVYGTKNAERIGYEIAECGGIVVTGLAKGIDSAAARGALRGNGRVVGVLGCGVDVIYPSDNARLYNDVCVNGALISEYPPGYPPNGHNFPVRNRIMSGISNGVLVIEAPKRSGALITAARALDQGRDVFVLPGNVDAISCEGSNQLLREGAAAIMSGADIISEYIAMFPDRLRLAPKSEIPYSDDADEKTAENPERSDGENDADTAEKPQKSGKIRHKAPKKPIDKDNGAAYSDLMSRPEGMTDDEYEVLKLLSTELQADEIVEKCNIPANRVLAALTLLEIQGYVVQKPGKHFARK